MRKEIQEKVRSVGPCDILIGIPTYNHADSIGPLVEGVRSGLSKHFPEARAILVNADGGSMDSTREMFASAADGLACIPLSQRVDPRNKITAPYHGIPGRESAFRMILEIADQMEAKVCVIVDAGVLNITPEWIERLVGPILDEGYDYVVPYHNRSRYDGTITSVVIYPLTRALYGLQIRQPLGGDFAFTGALAGRFLSEGDWESELARYGIDLWMTTTAIAEGMKVCQAYLGPKLSAPRDLGVDLSAMLVQVVGSAFALMEQKSAFWGTVSGSSPVPLVGFRREAELKPIPVNVERMIRAFRLGLNEFISLWEGVLSRGVLDRLTALRPGAEPFNFPDDLWARVVYDFAVAVHRRAMVREHLLKSFTPLYLGRVASFILETEQGDSSRVEEKIEALCVAFEREKPYLIDQWEKPSIEGGGT
jgi:hypothetical protein